MLFSAYIRASASKGMHILLIHKRKYPTFIDCSQSIVPYLLMVFNVAKTGRFGSSRLVNRKYAHSPFQ